MLKSSGAFRSLLSSPAFSAKQRIALFNKFVVVSFPATSRS